MEDFFLTPGQYRVLWEGVELTAQLLVWSFLLGVALSVVFGLMRLSENRILRGVALVYVEFARGISTIVLLFWMVFALPIMLGIEQPNRILMAVLALGLNMGGYGAEIVRGAILSVPKGQHEATIALNMTAAQRVRHVILPQSMPVILPPMGNLTIEILKGTALVALVGLSDLTQRMEALRVARGRYPPEAAFSVPQLFFNGLIMYFVLSQIVSLLFRLMERYTASRYRRRTGRRAVATDGSLHASSAGAGNA